MTAPIDGSGPIPQEPDEMLCHTARCTRQPTSRQSSFRAWGVLVVQSFQRLWRVRQMGWVSLGLLAVVVGWVAVVTASPAGWELPDRRVRRWLPTYREYAEQQLPQNRYNPERYDTKFIRGIAPLLPHEIPSPLHPRQERNPVTVLSIPHAVLQSEKFVKDWGFMNYSRWVITRGLPRVSCCRCSHSPTRPPHSARTARAGRWSG